MTEFITNLLLFVVLLLFFLLFFHPLVFMQLSHFCCCNAAKFPFCGTLKGMSYSYSYWRNALCHRAVLTHMTPALALVVVIVQ